MYFHVFSVVLLFPHLLLVFVSAVDCPVELCECLVYPVYIAVAEIHVSDAFIHSCDKLRSRVNMMFV